MSCQYSFEDLLALLQGHAPAKVDAVALHRRCVENGRLSVGLKIHCLDDGSQFTALVDGLGGDSEAHQLRQLVGREAVRVHDRLGATLSTAASEQSKRPALIGLGASTAGREGQQIGTSCQD